MSEHHQPLLWPPLPVIARELGELDDLNLEDDEHEIKEAVQLSRHAQRILLEASRRRDLARSAQVHAHPQPGDIYLIGRDSLWLPVMLNFVVRGHQWHGWLLGSDADWAGPFDVLIEVDDRSTEPFCGMVQTWNRVAIRVDQTSRWSGSVSPARLASIRAVSDECQSGLLPDTGASRPGQIGLRSTLGDLTVLTGTVLRQQTDPRLAYQALYQRSAERLMAAVNEPVKALAQKVVSDTQLGWFARWFGGGLMRPAFYALALVVLVENIWLFNVGQDDIRFRNKAAEERPTVSNVSVRWEADATATDMLEVLTTVDAIVVDGPSADGTYRLRASNPSEAVLQLNRSSNVAEAHAIRETSNDD